MKEDLHVQYSIDLLGVNDDLVGVDGDVGVDKVGSGRLTWAGSSTRVTSVTPAINRDMRPREDKARSEYSTGVIPVLFHGKV